MLTIAQVLRKQARQQHLPPTHKLPSVIQLRQHERKFAVDLYNMTPPPANELKAESGPDLQLRPRPLNQGWVSTNSLPEHMPTCRAGDREAAIKVRMQSYAVIALEAGSPSNLKVLDPAKEPTEPCCILPGMLESSLVSGGGIALPVAWQNSVSMREIPAVLLETFWSNLAQTMSEEGRALFEHFNHGMRPPSGGLDCYMRLHDYVKWVRVLAD